MFEIREAERSDEMNRLTIKADLLRLAGNTRTLRLAEAHNMRRMARGNSAIDPLRSHLNMELVPLGPNSLQEKVISILKDIGLNLSHYSYKKKNRGYGVELLFTVTDGYDCDFYSLFIDCIDWLRSYHPESVIAHAIIHFDEKTPHMHVVLVPIVDGKLQADKVRGYREFNTVRSISLFEYLDPDYGLGFPIFLKGAAKKMGAEKAIRRYKSLQEGEIRGMLDRCVIQAIHSRPEPFMFAMKVPMKEAFSDSHEQL
jgi:hypothetical protein